MTDSKTSNSTIPASTVRKTIRRKATAISITSTSDSIGISYDKSFSSIIGSFSDLESKIIEARKEFEKLQKEMTETKDLWLKEQKDYEARLIERNQQEEIARKREEETYKYEIALSRKKAEDEFAERKAKWEKELAEKKEEIDSDKKELETLRKQVAGFETEKEKAVREEISAIQEDLTDRFETERKLREQEINADKEILNLKISNLSVDNNRQNTEIETLKKAFDEATRQVKDIAVKVIEASNTGSKIPNTEE